jgi:hypothetical protein
MAWVNPGVSRGQPVPIPYDIPIPLGGVRVSVGYTSHGCGYPTHMGIPTSWGYGNDMLYLYFSLLGQRNQVPAVIHFFFITLLIFHFRDRVDVFILDQFQSTPLTYA